MDLRPKIRNLLDFISKPLLLPTCDFIQNVIIFFCLEFEPEFLLFMLRKKNYIHERTTMYLPFQFEPRFGAFNTSTKEDIYERKSNTEVIYLKNWVTWIYFK